MATDLIGLKTILNKFPIGAISANEQGEILLWNDRALLLLGLLEIDSVDLMQDGMAALCHDKKISESWEAIRYADNKIEQLEICKDEKCLSFNFIKDGLKIFEAPIALILITDTTEKKKLETSRVWINEILHRIRSPLTSIKTSFAFLSSESMADSTLKPIQEIIGLGHTEIINLNILIEDLAIMLSLENNMAQSEIFLENVDLRILLQRMSRQFKKIQSERGREITLTFQDEDEDFHVIADYDKLEMVLNNLAINAFDQSSKSSKVEVFIKKILGKRIEISVIYSGSIISEEELPHVFDKFYGLQPSSTLSIGGSGLGLYLTKEFVLLMNGVININGEDNNKTKITIELPMVPENGWAD